MIQIIRKSERVTEVYYERVFQWRGESKNCGFAFQCNKNGNILGDLSLAAGDNLTACLTGKHDVVDKGVIRHEYSYRQAAIARCECGHILELASFTNTCSCCGRDYNMMGQRLASRQQWGEETGESPSEILGYGHHIS